MNILMLWPEFPDTFWSFKYAIDFVQKKACNPPLGLLTIAAMLPKEWNKRVIDLNVTQLEQKDIDWADQVWISAMAVQRSSAEDLIHLSKLNHRKVVAGGPLFTGEHDSFPEVDHFVLNEAELTLTPFLNDLANGRAKRVYQSDGYADLQDTPVPLWDLLDLKAYDAMNIQFSRGCPFNCDFCNVTALLGHRPRTKSKQQLISELDSLYDLGWRRNIFLVDDNFIGNKKVLKEEILPALIEWRKGKIGCLFLTEVSINLADDPQLMSLMTQAGFNSVFVGVETPDEESLAACNKTQNENRDLLESVKKLQRAGLQVMGGFIVGFDSDKETIFQRQIDFIQQSGIVTAMVGLLQAPHGTRLYQRMQDEGRLLVEMTGDNTDGTTNIIPLMDPATLHEGYQRILASIYSIPLFYQRVRTLLKELKPARSTVHIEPEEISALFKAIWRMGVLGSGQWEFWKFFFWSMFHCPDKFPLAITFTVYGYHFRKVSALHVLGETKQLSKAATTIRQLSTQLNPTHPGD